MKKIELLKMIEKYPLLTFNEFIRITGSDIDYARTYLSRLEKEKLITRIEKGKYTTHDDPLIFSSHIIVPSYISFWTALRYYNLTEQLPVNVMIASAMPKKTITINGTRIQFHKISHLWGYKKETYRGHEIFIAEKEKSIIDSLMLGNVPFDEIAKAVRTKEFDEKILIEYTLRTKNKSLMKRIGFMTEYFGMDAGQLTPHLDNNYISLDPKEKNTGKNSKKWKIIINRRLDAID